MSTFRCQIGDEIYFRTGHKVKPFLYKVVVFLDPETPAFRGVPGKLRTKGIPIGNYIDGRTTVSVVRRSDLRSVISYDSSSLPSPTSVGTHNTSVTYCVHGLVRLRLT